MYTSKKALALSVLMASSALMPAAHAVNWSGMLETAKARVNDYFYAPGANQGDAAVFRKGRTALTVGGVTALVALTAYAIKEYKKHKAQAEAQQ